MLKSSKKKAAMFGLDARIALAIFGALSVISGAALYSALGKTEQTVLLTELREIGKAWEVYYLDTSIPWLPIYSPSTPELNYLRDMRAFKSNIANLQGWKGPYLPYELDSADYRLKHPRYKYVYLTVERDITWQTPGGALCNYTDPCYVWASIAGIPDKSTVEKIDTLIDGSSTPSTGDVRWNYTDATFQHQIFLKIEAIPN